MATAIDIRELPARLDEALALASAGGDGQDWFFVPKSGDTITDLDFNPSDPKSTEEKTTKSK